MPTHTAQPRVLSDSQAILAKPADYPATLVQLARLAAMSARGMTPVQRHRATTHIAAPCPTARRIWPTLATPLPRPDLRLIDGGRA